MTWKTWTFDPPVTPCCGKAEIVLAANVFAANDEEEGGYCEMRCPEHGTEIRKAKDKEAE